MILDALWVVNWIVLGFGLARVERALRTKLRFMAPGPYIRDDPETLDRHIKAQRLHIAQLQNKVERQNGEIVRLRRRLLELDNKGPS